MSEKYKSRALKYEGNREYFRRKARSDFLKFHEKSNELIISLNEVVARHMYYAEEKTWDHIENGEYFSKLIVSFTRSHFILYDLIVCSELLDSSVLFRKQMELVSRFSQLTDDDVDIAKLLNKTPHVGRLDFDLSSLYSEYSSLAHSSNVKRMSLLGSIRTEDGYYSAVFPEFDENSYVAFNHLFLLVSQYHYEIVRKYKEWFPDYDPSEDCEIFSKSLDAFNEIYVENSKFKTIQKSGHD